MKTVSFFGKTLWILWMAAAAGRPALAFDGCRAADVNGDGVVDQADVDVVVSLIGLPAEREDLDGDGIVGYADLIIVQRFQEIAEKYPDILCPVCPADLDCNGSIDSEDRQELEAASGRDCRPDLNRDGFICPRDVELLEEYLGGAPLSAAAARADLDGDEDVDDRDRALLEERINGSLETRDCRLDLNRDGVVDAGDFWYLLASWGPCPHVCAFRGPPDLAKTCDPGGVREGDPAGF